MEIMKSTELYASPLPGMIPAEPPELASQVEDRNNFGCAACLAHQDLQQTEDEILVASCLKGDQRAWERLIDKYKRLIFSIPLKYGASQEDAADVFQAVCIEVFNSLPNLNNVHSLRSWLITVSVRQAYRWRKAQSHDIELDAMEIDLPEKKAFSPTEALAQVQQEQIVREVVGKLPPRCAELVKMLFFEQPPLPYAEVARRLGLATGSIGFIRGRCLERLRKTLLEFGFGG